MKRIQVLAAFALSTIIASAPVSAGSPVLSDADYRADAMSFEGLVNERYAYLDRFEGGQYRLTDYVRQEATAVHDPASLLTFLEHAIALMADHHAITGSAHSDSWGLVPSYADIWVVRDRSGFRVSDVKTGSPAAAAVMVGDDIVSVSGLPIEDAVVKFWSELGVSKPNPDQEAFAARVLLAGRRDRSRAFVIRRGADVPRTVELPNLYAARNAAGKPGPVSVTRAGQVVRIRMNDSLGETEAIAAFDAAMAKTSARDTVIVDLTDTGSGGTSTVARAMMGWFVDRPRPYQMHSSPEEFRQTGIARQWAEYVLPRAGKHHAGKVMVKVGRWTGSMGEGLAVGFDALGVPVCGSPMAGLLGAIEDIRLERSGQVVKFSTERLTTISGTPRESFRPRPLDDRACAADRAAR